MLPQSQLDRFMICMHIGYPDMKYELEIVKGKITTDPLDLVEPVMNGAQLLCLQDEIHKIYIHDAVYQYIGKLVNATRKHSLIELGISQEERLHWQGWYRHWHICGGEIMYFRWMWRMFYRCRSTPYPAEWKSTCKQSNR